MARTKEIVVGPADDLESGMGPLVSDVQLATVKKYVEIGKEEGAAVVVSKQPEGLTRVTSSRRPSSTASPPR